MSEAIAPRPELLSHGSGLVDRFSSIASRFAGRPAVEAGGTVTTYGALNEHARRIADALGSAAETAVDQPIALLLQPGAQMVAAILGVLFSGHPYSVLSAAEPRPRLAAMFADLQSPLLITDDANRAAAQALTGGNAPVVDVSRLPAGRGATQDPADRSALAYVLYTSGSTGAPKGVIQTQRAVLLENDSAARAFGFGEQDRFALLSSPAFGQTTTLLFRALLSGGCLVLRDLARGGTAGLAEWLLRERITVYQSVPSVFRALTGTLTGRTTFGDLRLLRLGGEPVSASDVHAFRRHFHRDCRLVISYGSTETKQIARFVIDHSTELPGDVVPVGRTVEDVYVRLCDAQGEESPPGETGELRVRSPRLSPGYWRDEAMTRRRFPECDSVTGEREFLTGDLGRRLADGALVLEGRVDRQLKVRGFRVSPAAVEAALRALPGVEQAAVVGRTATDGDTRLEAYVTTLRGAERDAPSLRAALRERVPPYMVPARLSFVEAMPMLPNGKLDRDALAAGAPPPRQPDAEPLSGDVVEREVAHIWSEVLGTQVTDLNADFFDLGGSSLQAGTMLARLEQSFGVDVPVAVLADARTVRTLAARIGAGPLPARPIDTGRGLVMALREHGEGAPVFIVPGGGGGEVITFSLYAELARHMDPARPIFAFVYRGPKEGDRRGPDLRQLAAEYARELRRTAAGRRFHVVGHCRGGVVALEMARLLDRSKEAPEALVMIDTRLRSPLSRVARNTKLRMRLPAGFLRLFASRAAHHLRTVRGRGLFAAAALVVSKLARTRDLYDHATNPFLNAFDDETKARQTFRAHMDYRLKLPPEVPAAYDGPVVVLANSQWHAKDPLLGWQSVLRGPVQARALPGTHTNHIRRHAAEVARIVDECLDSVERSRGAVAG